MRKLEVFIIIISAVLFIRCNNIKTDTIIESKSIIAATLEDDNFISLDIIDSIIADQVHHLKINALDIVSSKAIMELEANKRHISMEELVENEINNKTRSVTETEILEYVDKIDEDVSLENAEKYLLFTHRQKRERQFTDSLKEVLNYRVKLIPPYLSEINTNLLHFNNLNNNNSPNEVFIISDFECYSCQNAQKKINKLLQKYNRTISFKFIYLSSYIRPDIYLACRAAENQNKFKQMYDIISRNAMILDEDSVFQSFAKMINLDLETFNSDFLNDGSLSEIIETKDFLLSQGIYSTPSFIVNSKVIDGKFAIDYLEDVIIKEFGDHH